MTTGKNKYIKNCCIILFFICAALLSTSYTNARHLDDRPFANSYYVVADNLKIHYRYWQCTSNTDNNWMLLVHGMGGSTYSWENNASFFSENGFNVIAIDIPPYGYSDKYPYYNHSIDKRAELIWKFTEKINPGNNWHLMGHSMGGGIVQAMAILKPEKVNKVVFVAPSLLSYIKTERVLSQRILLFSPFERIAVLTIENILLNRRRVEKYLRSALGSEPTKQQVDEYYKALKVPGTTRAILRTFTQPVVNSPLDGTKFSNNAIAVIGEKDSWIPKEVILRRVEKISSIEAVIFTDAAHSPMETHHDFFNKTVLNFLFGEN